MAENETEMMIHVLTASLDVLTRRCKLNFDNLHREAKRINALIEKIAELEKRKIVNIKK